MTLVPCSLRCGRSIYFSLWLGLTVLYKIVLHLVGFVLLCRIKRIEVSALNDYKSHSALMYISTVLIFSLVGVLFIFNTLFNLQNTSATAISVVIFLECLTFLGLTFIPKVSLVFVCTIGTFYSLPILISNT